MIYSRKYGRAFKNRSELSRYAWREARSRPIFSWWGLRDCLYSEEWKQEHGLKSTSEQLTRLVVVVGVAFVSLGGLLLLAGILGGLFMLGIGLLCFWVSVKGRDN